MASLRSLLSREIGEGLFLFVCIEALFLLSGLAEYDIKNQNRSVSLLILEVFNWVFDVLIRDEMADLDEAILL